MIIVFLSSIIHIFAYVLHSCSLTFACPIFNYSSFFSLFLVCGIWFEKDLILLFEFEFNLMNQSLKNSEDVNKE